MNKRLLWLLIASFILANILAGIKVSRSYRQPSDSSNKQIEAPVSTADFPVPSTPPPSAAVTKQDIAKITCPKPLSADNWLVATGTNSLAELNFGNYRLSSQEKQTVSRSYQQQGTNLAGYFHLSSWSCGVNCQKAAIINTKTGRMIAFGTDDDLQTKTGWQFSATSSLLTINPNSQDKQNPTIYALVEDGGLRRICYLAQ